MNLFNCIPPVNGETFTTLLEHKNVKIIRIVSSDAPDRKLYRQEEDEWAVVLEGSAVLEIDGKRRRFRRGECVFLPSGTPHRVLETSPGTLWLAVHIHDWDNR